MYVLMAILPIEQDVVTSSSFFTLFYTGNHMTMNFICICWNWSHADICSWCRRYISGCTLWLQISVVTKSLFKVFLYSALYLGYKGNQTSITKSNMSLISSLRLSFPLCKRCNGKGDSSIIKINFLLWKCERHMVKS